MSNKDIFDQIREEAEQIRETPSPQAWSRIEQRLKTDRPGIERNRVRSLRPQLSSAMSMAAGLALILGLVVVFSWMSKQEQISAPMAQADPLEWEELTIDPPSANNSTEVIEIAAAHPRPVALNPIEEGNSSQRLIAKHEAPVRSTIRNSQQDSARKAAERRGR